MLVKLWNHSEVSETFWLTEIKVLQNFQTYCFQKIVWLMKADMEFNMIHAPKQIYEMQQEIQLHYLKLDLSHVLRNSIWLCGT